MPETKSKMPGERRLAILLVKIFRRYISDKYDLSKEKASNKVNKMFYNIIIDLYFPPDVIRAWEKFIKSQEGVGESIDIVDIFKNNELTKSLVDGRSQKAVSDIKINIEEMFLNNIGLILDELEQSIKDNIESEKIDKIVDILDNNPIIEEFIFNSKIEETISGYADMLDADFIKIINSYIYSDDFRNNILSEMDQKIAEILREKMGDAFPGFDI